MKYKRRLDKLFDFGKRNKLSERLSAMQRIGQKTRVELLKAMKKRGIIDDDMPSKKVIKIIESLPETEWQDIAVEVMFVSYVDDILPFDKSLFHVFVISLFTWDISRLYHAMLHRACVLCDMISEGKLYDTVFPNGTNE